MKPQTVSRIAQAIQLLKLDCFENYTNRQISDATGVTTRTITRNKDLITMLDFSLSKGGYDKCILQF